jgi:hypothetical protein
MQSVKQIKTAVMWCLSIAEGKKLIPEKIHSPLSHNSFYFGSVRQFATFSKLLVRGTQFITLWYTE